MIFKKREFNILLKKFEDSETFPYGIEICVKQDIGLQNLLKSDLTYLSASL